MKFKDVFGDLTGRTYNDDLLAQKYDLDDLKGFPAKVNGSIVLDNNDLYSLQYLPKETMTFSISSNNIKSLKGSPEKVDGNFFCERNRLTSLEGTPYVINGSYDCSDNPLESLYTGRPIKIKGIFTCESCPNLKDPIHEIIKNQIKAIRYETDNGKFDFSFIEKEFNEFLAKNDSIKRKGFRTLLGLNK